MKLSIKLMAKKKVNPSGVNLLCIVHLCDLTLSFITSIDAECWHPSNDSDDIIVYIDLCEIVPANSIHFTAGVSNKIFRGPHQSGHGN